MLNQDELERFQTLNKSLNARGLRLDIDALTCTCPSGDGSLHWPCPAHPPATPGRKPLTDEVLTDLIAQRLSGTYHCLRVWDAWRIGTMGEDDFADVGESDTPGELAREILATMQEPAQQAVEPTDERTAFEAWIAKDGGDLSKFGRGPNIHYRNSAVNNAWTGWKACAKIAAGRADAQPAGLSEPEELTEPVSIAKAMRAHRKAHVVLDKGTGPLCFVSLVNIQLTGWNMHSIPESHAYAEGFNTGARVMRESLLAARAEKGGA